MPPPPLQPRRDRARLYAAAASRSAAVGIAGAVLGIYLDKKGLGPVAVGVVVMAGLSGGALAAGAAALRADVWGRRRTLIGLAALGALGGLGLAWAETWPALALAAFVGMINGMGHDRGGAYALEQSALAHEPGVAQRTWSLAGYHALGDLGCVAGSLAAMSVSCIGYRALWLGYAALLAAGLLLYPGLSATAEAGEPPRPFSALSRARVGRFAALSALDSLGSGFLSSALLSYYFYRRFGVSEAPIALLWAAADVLNIASNFLAARLARRWGLVNTMVFTHLPSSLLLLLLPLCPNFTTAAALFLLRELLVEMDVPTRQSYLASIVSPSERTAALGLVQLTRTSMWALGPGLAGGLMAATGLSAPLCIGAGLKAGYDLLLWRAFRRVEPSYDDRAL